MKCRSGLKVGLEELQCSRNAHVDRDHVAGGYSWTEPNPKSKFRNVKVTVDGIRFDSLGEAARYIHLKDLERRGEIQNLVCHPSYELKIGAVRIGKYSADFGFDIGDEHIVEDYKVSATKTEAYGLRKKLMYAIHGIKVVESGPASLKKKRKGQ